MISRLKHSLPLLAKMDIEFHPHRRPELKMSDLATRLEDTARGPINLELKLLLLEASRRIRDLEQEQIIREVRAMDLVMIDDDERPRAPAL